MSSPAGSPNPLPLSRSAHTAKPVRSLGTWADLPWPIRAEIEQKKTAAPIFDRSAIGCRSEINKGWYAHELNPDDQASMMARPDGVLVTCLRAARLAKGWTQGKVAALAGVSTSLVSIAERLTIGVSPDARARICAALGIAIRSPN